MSQLKGSTRSNHSVLTLHFPLCQISVLITFSWLDFANPLLQNNFICVSLQFPGIFGCCILSFPGFVASLFPRWFPRDKLPFLLWVTILFCFSPPLVFLFAMHEDKKQLDWEPECSRAAGQTYFLFRNENLRWQVFVGQSPPEVFLLVCESLWHPLDEVFHDAPIMGTMKSEECVVYTWQLYQDTTSFRPFI